MVSHKAKQRKTVIVGIILGLISVVVVAFGVYYVLNALLGSDSSDGTSEEVVPIPAEPEPEPEPEPAIPDAIDFQSIVDQWATSVGGNRSVIIYDLDRDEMSASYNVDEDYNTASLYKLFVVYEGYRRVQNGTWDGNKVITGGRTILDCLDLAIRESNSQCAETLWAMIGHDELDGIIESDFGITGSDISRLISNPTDILKIMKIFHEHKDITDETLIARMKDSFLVQPVTTYNWRQGLPSGFSAANVYNKVGWDYNPNGGYWNIYHDTAIVEFPESDRHFIVVVMTNQVPFEKIRELGGMIEKAITV